MNVLFLLILLCAREETFVMQLEFDMIAEKKLVDLDEGLNVEILINFFYRRNL